MQIYDFLTNFAALLRSRYTRKHENLIFLVCSVEFFEN